MLLLLIWLLLSPAPTALPPCLTEDSTGCYWDAQHMGNHEGNSFIAPVAPAPCDLGQLPTI